VPYLRLWPIINFRAISRSVDIEAFGGGIRLRANFYLNNIDAYSCRQQKQAGQAKRLPTYGGSAALGGRRLSQRAIRNHPDGEPKVSKPMSSSRDRKSEGRIGFRTKFFLGIGAILLFFQKTERLASLGQLSAGIAHEINNPLGVILTYTSLLKRQLESMPQCLSASVMSQPLKSMP